MSDTWEEFVDKIFRYLHIDQIFPQEKLMEIKVKIKTHSDLNAFLANLMSHKPEVKKLSPCRCGIDLETILQIGKFGCSHCYQHFYEAINPYIVQIQGRMKHVGKTPKNLNQPKIDNLEKEMNQAAVEERYEDAAVIRDRIKELRGL